VHKSSGRVVPVGAISEYMHRINAAHALVISPANTWLAVATCGVDVQIWDHERSEPIHTLTWGSETVSSVKCVDPPQAPRKRDKARWRVCTYACRHTARSAVSMAMRVQAHHVEISSCVHAHLVLVGASHMERIHMTSCDPRHLCW
jgi:hypothetical protein